MDYDFFAYLGRMNYIKRWALMRSTVDENIKEHSFDVAMIAHALTLIENKMYGASIDVHKVVCLALYHEAGEVITGDLPTPIKYFNSQINSAYKELEKRACEKLLRNLPEELKEVYSEYLLTDEESLEYKIMKSADRISAYIKCVNEVKSGNKEFVKAKASIGKSLKKSDMACVKYFIDYILPSFEKTLDELDFGVE